MKNLAKAIALTAKLFENKLDKGGQPYILHCLYVGEVDGDECVKCASVMHDVIEDTAYTIEMLRCLGFSEKTLKILDLLTHEDGVDYMDYIKKLSTNQDAIKMGGDIGIKAKDSHMWVASAVGVRSSYDNMTRSVTSYRS